ncbi:MAG TPA: ROK family protein [Terriglobales bacterium]|jgi:3-dehydroquinate synthetase/predicted NBD/HSP70 family sugar kinase
MEQFPVALGHGNAVATFDIGGTSFRSALLTREGRLTSLQRIPSINHRSMPGASATEVLGRIADYIAGTAQSFSIRQPPAIAISMGAAMNAHTGVILGSGPILGDNSACFDLKRAIKERLPGAQVAIVNDVTASLIAHSLLPDMRHARRLSLITVSTGIASRTLNCSVPHVPVDAELGVQGEIGHHPINFLIDGQPLSLKCDCGGTNHLSAFASGEGIKNVLKQLPDVFPSKFAASVLSKGEDPDVSLDRLADGLAKGDSLSKTVLRAITQPIAEAAKWHFMLDPELDKLILTGGVCFFLRDAYLESVIENLCELGYYPLESETDSFWADRVILGPISDDAGLIGAASVAREVPNLHRCETLTSDFPFRVSREHSIDYPIHLSPGICRNGVFPQDLLEPFERIILVSDFAVDDIYGERLQRVLAGPGRQVETIILRASEKEKDLGAIAEVASHFDMLGVRRRQDLIVAAGGGITLDIVGFSANLFRRGIPCLKIPTTLVGAIDAGIGVKNAVNFRYSKSRLGTFCPPFAVVIDPDFLSTLSERQIRNGLSESLKIGLVADGELFRLIQENAPLLIRTKLQNAKGLELIRRSIKAMLLELAPNLFERTLTRLPDYGHTFSPIFEFELPDLEHGEAVALDMAFATALAVVLGILDRSDAEEILLTQHVLGLPIVRPGMSIEMLLRGVREAKRHRGGYLRMPVLSGIGESRFIDEVSQPDLEKALGFIWAWSGGKTLEVAQSA